MPINFRGVLIMTHQTTTQKLQVHILLLSVISDLVKEKGNFFYHYLFYDYLKNIKFIYFPPKMKSDKPKRSIRWADSSGNSELNQLKEYELQIYELLAMGTFKKTKHF